MRTQHLADCRLQGRQQFALFDLLIRCEPDARKQVPGIGFERDLAALPGTLAQLDGRFEQGKLVYPGREAAFAAKVVEVREDADQRVAGGLVRDLLKLVTQVGQAAAAARRLEACGAQEQPVQTSDRLVASGTVGPKSEEPLARSVVDRWRCRRKYRHRPLGTAPAASCRDRLCSLPDKLLLRESGGDQQQRRAEDGECGREGLGRV